MQEEKVDTEQLYDKYKDANYKKFAKSLSPTDKLDRIGIRIPDLRKLAKTIKADDIEIKYHEDVILKGLAITNEKISFNEKAKKLDKLLPYLSSWDQTDIIQSAFKPTKSNKEDMYIYFKTLLQNKDIFTRRLAIVWLMSNRKKYNKEEILDLIISSDSDEYYIMMAVAWALSYFYFDDKETLALFDKVSAKTKKKAIQKINESKRLKDKIPSTI